MKKLIATTAAIAVMGISASAFAETLKYDFTVEVTGVSVTGTNTSALKGVLKSAGAKKGETLNVSVDLNTAGKSSITVKGLEKSATNITWGSPPSSNSDAQTWTQGQDNSQIIWQGGSSLDGEVLKLNGTTIIKNSGNIWDKVWLDFSKTSSGSLVLNSGWLKLGAGDHLNALIEFKVKKTPVSTPELDPASGVGAMTLLLGGIALAFSSRPRLSVKSG